jgi:hypothetical protein
MMMTKHTNGSGGAKHETSHRRCPCGVAQHDAAFFLPSGAFTAVVD